MLSPVTIEEVEFIESLSQQVLASHPALKKNPSLVVKEILESMDAYKMGRD